MSNIVELPEEKPAPYSQVRDLIDDGDVILFRGERELSKVMVRFSHGAYSHVGLVLTWFGRRMLLSAEMPKIQVIPLSITVASYPGRVDWYKLLPEARARLDMQKLAIESLVNLGVEYGTNKLLELAAHFMIGTKVDDKDEKVRPNSMVCSQYVSRCFRMAGVDLSPLSDLATVPGEIAGSPLLHYTGTLKSELAGADEVRLHQAL